MCFPVSIEFTHDVAIFKSSIDLKAEQMWMSLLLKEDRNNFTEDGYRKKSDIVAILALVSYILKLDIVSSFWNSPSISSVRIVHTDLE